MGYEHPNLLEDLPQISFGLPHCILESLDAPVLVLDKALEQHIEKHIFGYPNGLLLELLVLVWFRYVLNKFLVELGATSGADLEDLVTVLIKELDGLLLMVLGELGAEELVAVVFLQWLAAEFIEQLAVDGSFF